MTRAMDYANHPFYQIGTAIFDSPSSIQFANIDAIYGIMKEVFTSITKTSDNIHRFLDIGGDAIEYINYRLPQAKGIVYLSEAKQNSISSYERKKKEEEKEGMEEGMEEGEGENEDTEPGIDSKFSVSKITPDFIILRGENDHGDILKDEAYLHKIIYTKEPYGFETVFANSDFFHWYPKAKEANNDEMIRSMCVLGLRFTSENGNFILRLMNTDSYYSKKIIQLVSTCFKQVYMMKPVTSNPTEPDKFLIALGKADNEYCETVTSLLDLPRSIFSHKVVLDPDFYQWFMKLEIKRNECRIFSLTLLIVYLNASVQAEKLCTTCPSKIPDLFVIPRLIGSDIIDDPSKDALSKSLPYDQLKTTLFPSFSIDKFNVIWNLP